MPNRQHKSPHSKQHEPSAEEILLARRMNRNGAELNEIHAALGWPCLPRTTYERLLRGGVRVRFKAAKRAHFGDETNGG